MKSKKESSVKRPDIFRDTQVVSAVVRLLTPYSLIPELFDCVQHPATAFKILQTFAGLTLRFPDLETIRNVLISVDIFCTISANPDNLNGAISSLRKSYAMKKEDVQEVYKELCRVIGENDSNLVASSLTYLDQAVFEGKGNYAAIDYVARQRLKGLQTAEHRSMRRTLTKENIQKIVRIIIEESPLGDEEIIGETGVGTGGPDDNVREDNITGFTVNDAD